MRANDYREQVCAAISATAILSPASFAWFGRPSEPLPPRVKRTMTARTTRNYLLSQLQNRLYTDFYIRGKASPKVWNDEGQMESGTDFVEGLSRANAGSGCREAGWEVTEVVAEEVAVRRHRLTLWVTRADLDTADGEAIPCGAKVTLRMAKELRSISPGYYLALGDRADPEDDAAPLVRMYWNLKPEGSEGFLRDATSVLNRNGFFFRLKLLNDVSAYTRCDAAVLYVRRVDYAPISLALAAVYARVAAHLKALTPAFTKMLAPGLGVAEDPGGTESFGQHRCRLLAEGLIRSYEQGVASLDGRLQVVSDCFKAAGLGVDRPYLGPGSLDPYTFAR